MKTIEQKVYHCDYCKRYSIHKNVMSRHEKICSNNPINKHACFDCIHLKKEVRTEMHQNVHDYPYALKITDFTCLKTDNLMRTYKTEHSRRLNAYYGNLELMPNVCEFQEYITDDIDMSDLDNLF